MCTPGQANGHQPVLIYKTRGRHPFADGESEDAEAERDRGTRDQDTEDAEDERDRGTRDRDTRDQDILHHMVLFHFFKLFD